MYGTYQKFAGLYIGYPNGGGRVTSRTEAGIKRKIKRVAVANAREATNSHGLRRY